MRLPERYKQNIYIMNDGDIEPIKIRGIVTPINDTIATGGGISVQGNTDDLKFESALRNVGLINQKTNIWIRKKPDIENNGTDFTHKVIGRSPTTNGWFITIHCKSVDVDVPIL